VSTHPPLLVYIAWRNLWRNRIRSVLTISALGIGLALMIVYATLVEGMYRQMANSATQISTSHFQIHRQAYADDQDLYALLPQELLAVLDTVPRVRVAPRLYAAGLAAAGDQSVGVMLKAIDPEREARVTSMLEHIRSGEMNLGKTSTQQGEVTVYHVLVGTQLARSLRIAAGDEVVIITQAADGGIGNGIYRVGGILKPIEAGFDRAGVLMSIDAFRELMFIETGMHEIAVNTDDLEQLSLFGQHLSDALAGFRSQHSMPEYGGKLVLRNWRQLVPAVSDMLEMSGTVIYIIGGILVGLAALGMMNTMLMAVHERTHEFGILLAIGMSRYRLLTMVMLESFFLSLVAMVVGVALGASSSHYLEVTGIDLTPWLPDGMDWAGVIWDPVWKGYLTGESVVVGIVIMVVVAMLASLIPSWRTVRMKPAEAIR